MTNAPGSNAYLRTQVMTASPAELRLMLFDGAIRFAEQSKTGLLNKDYAASYTGAMRCQNILLELINGLRPERDPALCEKLSSLYTFMYMKMVQAGSERNPELIDEVLKLLHYERDTWVMLLDQLAVENKAARSMEATPDAQPTLGSAGCEAAQELIGGTVSVRG